MTPIPRAPYLLFRVDDRLLHGQVALGWGRHLHPSAYLVCDDAVAADADAAEMYRYAAAEGEEVVVRSADALLRGEADLPDPAWTVLLVRSIEAAARLLRAGVPGPLNLGGMHLRPGACEVLPYLYLTSEDLELLRALLDEGFELFAQELPGGARRGAGEFLR